MKFTLADFDRVNREMFMGQMTDLDVVRAYRRYVDKYQGVSERETTGNLTEEQGA